MKSIIRKNQKILYTKKNLIIDGESGYTMTVTIRYDDECGNGHNSFSITGWYYVQGNKRNTEGGGCCHEIIAEHFPELKKYIKYHFMNSDGPLYYISNTMYIAGTKDCRGYNKGEISSYKDMIQFGEFPMLFNYDKNFIDFIVNNPCKEKLEIIEIEYKKDGDNYKYNSNYTLEGYHVKWYLCPFNYRYEAENFIKAYNNYGVMKVSMPWTYGEGKEADLDGARRSAIWPDATLKQLTNKNMLEARLSDLIKDFKDCIKELNFIY